MLKQNLNHTSQFTHPTSNKGITLIALIITIIVMLILVAVTISMAINGGLFEKAGQAVVETQNEINKEQEVANGRVKINETWYDSIDDYLNGTPSADQENGTAGGEESGEEEIIAVHSWTRTGDTFICSHCNTTYELGQTVDYTASGQSDTTVTVNDSGLDKYYTENSNSYPTDANVDENGNQTIEKQETNWIILGIEDTDKDGVNETLLITTEKPVGATADKKLWLYGLAAYNNGPDEINRICDWLYGGGEGNARGMTIEDVNSVLKYVPDEASGENEYYYLKSDGTGIVNSEGTTINTVTTAEKNTIFGTSNDYIYILASHGAAGGMFGCAHVSMNTVSSLCLGMVIDGNYWRTCCSDSNGATIQWRGASFRPVVTIKSELPTSAC